MSDLPLGALTFSKLAVAWLLRLHNRIQTHGFRKAVLEILAKDSSGEFEKDDASDLRQANFANFVPDAYLIDRENKSVYAFEVEDTSDLTETKLEKLVDAYHILNYAHWDFKVFLLDRYAGNWRTIPLSETTFLSDRLELPSKPGEPRFKKVVWERTYDQLLRQGCLLPLAASYPELADANEGAK